MTTNAPTISNLSHHAALLAIELDLSEIGAHWMPPPPLNIAVAEAVAAHLAKDLQAILDDIAALGLIVPGALYDQTEILRPGFPLIAALAELYQRSLQGGFTPAVMALGSEHGYLPVPALDPKREHSAGPLLLLPFCLVGPRSEIQRVAAILEERLLQDGIVSDATTHLVEQAFGIKALNMSLATLSDVCALLRMQLEASAMLPLWEMLEHAWFERPGVFATMLGGGNRFFIEGDHAHTTFYTFDDWAQFGPGQHQPSAELGAAYLEWAQLQRQYTTALEAYGLEVRWVLANPQLEKVLASDQDALSKKAAMREIPCLSGDYLVESILHTAQQHQEQQIIITHHADEKLGSIAYTVASLSMNGELLGLEHHYPLRPQGLGVIIERLVQRCEEQGAQRQVLHPGKLLYSEEQRNLQSEQLLQTRCG